MAEPEIQAQLIGFVQEASYSYWDWVAAGEYHSIATRILALAEDRTSRIEAQVKAGLIDPRNSPTTFVWSRFVRPRLLTRDESSNKRRLSSPSISATRPANRCWLWKVSFPDFQSRLPSMMTYLIPTFHPLWHSVRNFGFWISCDGRRKSTTMRPTINCSRN